MLARKTIRKDIRKCQNQKPNTKKSKRVNPEIPKKCSVTPTDEWMQSVSMIVRMGAHLECASFFPSQKGSAQDQRVVEMAARVLSSSLFC